MPPISPPASVSSHSARSASVSGKRRPRSPVSFFGDGIALGVAPPKPPKPLMKLEKKSKIKKMASTPSIALTATSSESSLPTSFTVTSETEASSGSSQVLKRRVLSIASIKTSLSKKSQLPVSSPTSSAGSEAEERESNPPAKRVDSPTNKRIDQVLLASDAFVPLHPMPRHKSSSLKSTTSSRQNRAPPSPSLPAQFAAAASVASTFNHQGPARPESSSLPTQHSEYLQSLRRPDRQPAKKDPAPAVAKIEPSATLHTSPLSLHSESGARPRTDSQTTDDSGLEFFHDDTIHDQDSDDYGRRVTLRAERTKHEWRGHWNQNDMDNVISKLRQLK